MELDLAAELAFQFKSGQLSGDEYLRRIEAEREESMPQLAPAGTESAHAAPLQTSR